MKWKLRKDKHKKTIRYLLKLEGEETYILFQKIY